MRIFETLAEASQHAASRWRAATSQGRETESRLWRYLGESTYFIHQTGQAYRFEDYLAGVAVSPVPQVREGLMAGKGETSQQALQLLLSGLEETAGTEQEPPVRVLVSLLHFLADTGQVDALEDYFNHRLDYAPLAIAFFATREEAVAWLNALSVPPSPARILIGDAYHLVWYSREEGRRDITREYVLEPYIEDFVARGIPHTTPSFKSRVETEAWLTNHPATPFAFVSIGGASYLAVHHKWLKRHTLHPVASTLREWEEEKKREAERQEDSDAAASKKLAE